MTIEDLKRSRIKEPDMNESYAQEQACEMGTGNYGLCRHHPTCEGVRAELTALREQLAEQTDLIAHLRIAEKGLTEEGKQLREQLATEKRRGDAYKEKAMADGSDRTYWKERAEKAEAALALETRKRECCENNVTAWQQRCEKAEAAAESYKNAASEHSGGTT